MNPSFRHDYSNGCSLQRLLPAQRANLRHDLALPYVARLVEQRTSLLALHDRDIGSLMRGNNLDTTCIKPPDPSVKRFSKSAATASSRRARTATQAWASTHHAASLRRASSARTPCATRSRARAVRRAASHPRRRSAGRRRTARATSPRHAPGRRRCAPRTRRRPTDKRAGPTGSRAPTASARASRRSAGPLVPALASKTRDLYLIPVVRQAGLLLHRRIALLPSFRMISAESHAWMASSGYGSTQILHNCIS